MHYPNDEIFKPFRHEAHLNIFFKFSPYLKENNASQHKNRCLL
jgi:hypothetical protein